VEKELGSAGGTVLDLGCGTGRQIGSHFMHRESVRWLAVDGSQKMLRRFANNMSSGQMHVDTILSRLDALDVQALPGCDVAMLSFVLTSLPDVSVVNRIVDHLRADALLIIADIHPAHTLASPYYDFKIDGRNVTLKPTPIYPDKLLENLLSKNFCIEGHRTIRNGSGADYAFMSIYRKKRP
jgi:2-polyprenyl-3-methyl-5-hydroxy-6-metoxy-1,4-benzoquinol methylase